MSRERDKFIVILNELENDYHAGNIPQEKYVHLRERYIHKINTIDASNRVRAMRSQDNRYNDSNRNYPPKNGSRRDNPYNGPRKDNPKYNKHSKRNRNPNYKNSKPKGYYDEDGRFHPYKSRHYNDGNLNNGPNNYSGHNKHNNYHKGPNKYHNGPNKHNNYYDPNNIHRNNSIDDSDKKTKSKTSVALIALFTIILLFAFGSGIFMGVFGDGFSIGGFGDLLGNGAAINDTAFPILDEDIPSIDYNSTSDYSSNYSSSSSDYSSYSSSDAYSDYSYDDSGSSSEGYDDSGSGSSSGSNQNYNYN